MISKPKIIIATVALALSTLFLLSQCKQAANKEGIESFLTLFGLQVQGGQTKALMENFDMPAKRAEIRQLINVLCNRTGMGKNSRPNFKVTVNTSDLELKEVGKDLTLATFSVAFSRDTLGIKPKTGTLSFKIKTIANRRFKIVDVDATAMVKVYTAYDNMIRSTILSDADIYSPKTLAAFKTAETLKARYDSIPWFQHMPNGPWFYVVKGKLNLYEGVDTDTVPTYKMGLVNAEQKEVIPVDYELIHNIGATFPNLIEVEKEHKRGFYNIAGQIVLPVEYDQILPLNSDDDLAILRKGNDYYHWKKDLTVSDKDAGVNIAEILPQVQAFGHSMKMNERIMSNIMESNSRYSHGSVYVAPSYLADWKLLPPVQNFKNPLRKNVEYDGASELYELVFESKTDNENWLSSVFHSINDNYLGGREGLYVHKNVLLVNKKSNRVYGSDISSYLSEGEGGGILTGGCSISKLNAINDSLYEVVIGANMYRELYSGKILGGGPEFHYLQLKDDKVTELRSSRVFGFTRYVKMDDSYLHGCYEYFDDNSTITRVNADMLGYMKNEIYAGYKYQFKDQKWISIFGQDPKYDTYHTSVDDSLTAIDKYNIAFIDQKLKGLNNKKPPLELNKNKTLAAQ